MLWALSVLAVLLAIRYPLQTLPLLFFEMTWKAAWLLAVALPRWSTGRMDPGTADTAFACLMVVIVPIVVQWFCGVENYVKKPGDPWRWYAARRIYPLGRFPLTVAKTTYPTHPSQGSLTPCLKYIAQPARDSRWPY